MENKNEPQSIRILSLGDSYTIGTGVETKDRWPTQLAGRLRNLGFELPEPVYIAQNGWTTAELLQAISSRMTGGNFDLVTLLIGVNNQYQGLDIDNYSRDFKQLIELAIKFNGGNPGGVVVLSIPDWSVTPFAESRNRVKISREIDQFNDANRRLSSGAGIQYVDITSLTRQVGSEAVYLADDCLHPSARMYTAWVERLLPVVLTAIGQ